MFDALATVLEARTIPTHVQTYSLARSREDLAQAFELVYDSYYLAGLVDLNGTGLRITPYHLLPTSEVLVAKMDRVVTSTLSIFGDGYLGLPMESMYPGEIESLRSQGLQLAEIGSLADRRCTQIRFIETFAQLGRLLAQVAQNRGIDGIVAAVHPKHARLYKRVMGFRQIGDLSDCPYANGNPAVALFLRFEEHKGTPLYDKYFGDPLAASELKQYRWSRETRDHFRRIMDLEVERAETGRAHLQLVS